MQPQSPRVTLLVAGLLQAFIVEANPHPMITAAPALPSHLLPRQDIGPNVFGYISGNVNSPLGCGAGYKFSAILSDYGIGACCNQVDCTSMVVACVDGGSPNGCKSEGCVGEELTTISCEEPKPSCFRYLLMSNAQDANPFYLPRCGTASAEIEVFAKATGQTSRAKTTQASSAAGGVSILGGGAGDTEVPNAGTATDGTTVRATTQSTPTSNIPNPPSNDENHNIRLYIAIGTLAGVVLISASVIGGVCIYRRRKTSNNIIDATELRDDISHLPSDSATNYGRGANEAAGKRRMSTWLGGLPGPGSSYGGNERTAYTGPSYQNPQFPGGGYAPLNRG